MKNVKIIYSPQPRERKKYILAWTERNPNANTIFINESFKKRLEFLVLKKCQNKKEIDIITYFLSTIIIHELTHLLFRWSGFNFSPPKLKDSGSFLERKLFDGEIVILTRPKSVWTPKSEHYGYIFIKKNFFKIFFRNSNKDNIKKKKL